MRNTNEIETTEETIDITPDTSIVSKIGKSGYTTPQALSEFVDNSVDARKPDGDGFKKITVAIDIQRENKSGAEPKISIEDDGVGMDKQTAAKSMVLALSSKKDGDMGEFGIGLKAAALSLGKTFRIETTQQGSAERYVLEYDQDGFESNGTFTDYVLRTERGDSIIEEHGTKIEITNLHKKPYSNLMGNVADKLSNQFMALINNNEVEITVNDKKCVPQPEKLIVDPDHKNRDADGREHFKFFTQDNYEVHGWMGLLEVGGLDKNGFRVYRNNRLIEEHQYIGFTQHSEYRQIIGEIHVNHLPVTHNKREFIKESLDYDEVLGPEGIVAKSSELLALLAEARRAVIQTQELNPGIQNFFDATLEATRKEFNKNPELRQYAFPGDQWKKKRGTKEENDGTALLDVEQRDDRDIVTVIEEPDETLNSRGRTPKRTHKRKRYFVWVAGKEMEVELRAVDLGNDEIKFEKNIEDKLGVIKLGVIMVNIGFPAYRASSRDYQSYSFQVAAAALAEWYYEENPDGDLTLKQLTMNIEYLLFKSLLKETRRAEIEREKERRKKEDEKLDKELAELEG